MNPASPEMRVAILARMVKQSPGQSLGRTQVMKLFYFLQELKGVHLGYDFRLFNYGPFDSEVLSDLSSACGLNTVVEKTVLYPRGYGYDISLGPQSERFSRELENGASSLAAAVDEVVREFGQFGAAELELRSTILFVDREMNQAGTSATEKEIAKRVKEVKPHFSEATIHERIEAMRRKGWLVSVP